MISLPKTWKGQSARIADNLYSSKEAQAFRLLKEANFWFARSAAMRRAKGPIRSNGAHSLAGRPRAWNLPRVGPRPR